MGSLVNEQIMIYFLQCGIYNLTYFNRFGDTQFLSSEKVSGFFVHHSVILNVLVSNRQAVDKSVLEQSMLLLLLLPGELTSVIVSEVCMCKCMGYCCKQEANLHGSCCHHCRRHRHYRCVGDAAYFIRFGDMYISLFRDFTTWSQEQIGGE